MLDAKWVDRQKGSAVRSRIVARQFATKSLEHLFAGTPDASVLRAVLSNLATDKDKVLLVAVVTSAYFQAPVVIDQYVRPPTDQRERGKLWKLKRAMPGLRIASRSWQDHYASVVEQTRCAFAQQEDGTTSAIWGDDLIGSGYRANTGGHEGRSCMWHSSATRVSFVGVDWSGDLAKVAYVMHG